MISAIEFASMGSDLTPAGATTGVARSVGVSGVVVVIGSRLCDSSSSGLTSIGMGAG
jgi:hypothetical protein